MRRFWWWFRLALLSICAVGLGAYLLTATPWRKWLGLAPDYSKEIAQGDRIAAAIYRFKFERGLWPEYLEDLSPEYLKEQEGSPLRDWFYELIASGNVGRMLPSLSTGATREGTARAHLGYDFDLAAPAWKVFSEDTERIVRPGPPPGVAETRGTGPLEAKRAERALAELDRRMAREPGVMEHWQDKASLLMALDRQAEVRDVVTAAAMRFPESAWPRLALATMALTTAEPVTGRTPSEAGAPVEAPEDIARFVDWVKAHPSMTRWFDVSWLYRQMGEVNLATKAMEEAVKQPIEVDVDDRNVAAYYLWDMARWGLENQRWDLVESVADAWEKAGVEGRVKEESYLALGAAARLAKGDAAAAKKDIQAAAKVRVMWARNMSALAAAVEKGDRGYRYNPGKVPGEFEVFIMPQ